MHRTSVHCSTNICAKALRAEYPCHIVGKFGLVWFGLFDLRPCQHDNGYLDGRSQIKVHTDERTQVHSAQSSLAVTHQGTNRARRSLTSVTESPSKHWSPLRTFKSFHFLQVIQYRWEAEPYRFKMYNHSSCGRGYPTGSRRATQATPPIGLEWVFFRWKNNSIQSDLGGGCNNWYI